MLSLAINGLAAYGGWWLRFPVSASQTDEAIEITNIDTNNVEELGDPDAREEFPPPEPEASPPELAPVPPPLDRPPEFEIPEATPTPTPRPANAPPGACQNRAETRLDASTCDGP